MQGTFSLVAFFCCTLAWATDTQHTPEEDQEQHQGGSPGSAWEVYSSCYHPSPDIFPPSSTSSNDPQTHRALKRLREKWDQRRREQD